MVFKSFVGIDVSKLTFDVHVALIDDINNGQHKVFNNNPKGFTKFLSYVSRKKGVDLESTLFCLENTGDYSLLLSHYLSKKECRYHLANPIEVYRSKGLVREKSDKIDSRIIMKYAYLKRDEIEVSQFPSLIILKIRNLNRHRTRLVKIQTSEKQYKKLLLQTTELVDNSLIISLCDDRLQFIKKQIKEIEKQIETLMEQNLSIQKNHDLIRTIPGVGPQLAINMIITTKNFTCFKDGRKYASFCGVAPFEHSSGTSIRGRKKTSVMCNKEIKALLTSCVSSLINHDRGIKLYHLRMKQKGKHTFIIINNIRAKLINRIFAVVKRGEPYINLNYN